MIRHTKFFMGLLLIVILLILILQLLILWRPVIIVDGHNYWAEAYNKVNTFAPLITVILLGVTFYYQKEQLHEQQRQTLLARHAAGEAQKQLSMQQIEGRFFAFLAIHRENGENMTYRKEKGKRVFIEIINKFNLIYEALEKIFAEPENSKQLKSKLVTSQKIEIAYLVAFYGCIGPNSIRMLTVALSPFDHILKQKDSRFGDVLVPALAKLNAAADGFQANLGHYFRHMFQTVIYIHNRPELTPEDKKFYLKRLRAQLSNHEIAVLFLNSFSLGKRWVSYHSKQQPKPVDLITSYRLIQNLPAHFFSQFDFRCFFPEITYEGSNKRFIHSDEYKKCRSAENVKNHG